MIGSVIFAAVLILACGVMLALAGFVSDLLRPRDDADDYCSRVDDALDDEQIRPRVGGWRS